MARSLVEVLDRRWYPSFGDNWDDDLFRERVLEHITPNARVLDLGAGAGIVRQMNFRGMADRVCGLDLDPRVIDNPYLDEAKIGTGEQIPYDDATFDVVFADNVLEHLPDPERVFVEVRRVLRPGGCFLAKTPNRWHYMPAIARLTPYKFHRIFNRLRGRVENDTFPTLYRANSPLQISRLARNAQLAIESVELIEGRPEYLRITAPTYVLGYAYERLVNSVSILAALRVLLIARLRRPES